VSWTTNGDGPAYSVNGSSSGSGSSLDAAGHIWSRSAPSAGALYLDTDTGVVSVASSSAWLASLASGAQSEAAGLALDGDSARSIVKTGIDLSAYTTGAATLALLWTWDGPMPGAGFSVIGVVGAANGTAGIQIVTDTSGGNLRLLAVTGSGATVAVLKTYSPASSFVGLHALAIAPVVVSAVHKWRFSIDGDAVADVAMGTPYVAPSSSAEVGLGSRSSGSSPVAGAMHALALWGSTLSSANILALATLPGTATHKLPLTASTGAPAIYAEACRFDALTPTKLPALGVAPLTVSAGVTKTTY